MHIIKLFNESPLPESIDNIRLFGAIYTALMEISSETAEIFKNKVKEGKIKISSAFPFVKNLLYFPKPLKMELINPENRKVLEKMKKFKKMKYISEKYLENILKIDYYDEDIIESLSEDNKIKKETITVPRNALNRITMKSDIFYEYYVYIVNGGVWFAVDSTTEDLTKIIYPALRFLKDRGLGPNYSVGFGQFWFEKDSEKSETILKIIEKIEDNTFLLLSKAIPRTDDLKDIQGFWNIKEMKGITREGYHIYPVYMFTEGSVVNKKMEGSVYDRIPNYLINGKSFLIPCKAWGMEK